MREHASKLVARERVQKSRRDADGSVTAIAAGGGRIGKRAIEGAISEIFLNTGKQGTAIDTNARDAAVAASLLLQYGCSVEILRRALTRNGDGSASGPLARALDLIQGAKP